jgi:CO dehydrogenase/acetyl-CoA synthase alpha subunit
MTDEELRTLVASLATSTANNAAEAHANAEAIRELRTTVEAQERVMTEGFATLRYNTDSQARNMEMMRENISYKTETIASSLELAAASQRTAAAAMELSAQTSRNLDRLENDIADLQQMMGIVIRDNQADRGRITRLEGQE